jgi:hypothetical protein
MGLHWWQSLKKIKSQQRQPNHLVCQPLQLSLMYLGSFATRFLFWAAMGLLLGGGYYAFTTFSEGIEESGYISKT